MIRRYASGAGLLHSEPLHQASFTAMRGIDSSKAVTVPNVVNRLENLTVNSDGSVSIRKPIIAKREFVLDVSGNSINATHVIPLYDNVHCMVIYSTGVFTYISVENDAGERFPLTFNGERLDYSGTFEFTLNTLQGAINVYDTTPLFNLKEVQGISTADRTVLGNVTVDLTHASLRAHLFDSAQDETTAKHAARYLVITRSDEQFTLTVKTPEVNTLSTGATLTLDPNLTLDNPFAIRDNYNANYAAIDGILPYVYCSAKDTPAKIDSYIAQGFETTDSVTHTYPSKSTFWKSVPAPGNPLIVEYLGHTPEFGSMDSVFARSGGAIRISLNEFKFNSAPRVCSAKPRRVHVSIVYRLLDNVSDSIVDSLTEGVSGGYYRTLNYDTNDDTLSILGDSSTGYYVQITGIPNAQHIVGNTLCTSDDNATISDSVNKITSVGRTLTGTVSLGAYEQSYQIFRYDTGSAAVYSGVGLYSMRTLCSVEYEDPDTPEHVLKYANESYIDINMLSNDKYKEPSAPSGRWLYRWMSDESVVGTNYHALTYQQPRLYALSANYTQESVETFFKEEVTSVVITHSIDETVQYSILATNETLGPNSAPINVSVGRLITALNGSITARATGSAPYSKVSYTVSIVQNGNTVFSETADVSPSASVPYSLNTDLSLCTYVITPTLTLLAREIPNLNKYSVREITEKVAYPKFQLANVVKPSSTATVLLKAFITIPKANVLRYGIWEYSEDGVHWHSWYTLPDGVDAPSELKKINLLEYTMPESSITSPGQTLEERSVVGVVLNANSPDDYAYEARSGDGSITTELSEASCIVPLRADVLVMQNLNDLDADLLFTVPNIPIDSIQIRFTIAVEDTEDVTNEDVTNEDVTACKVLGTYYYTPNIGLKWDIADTLLGNAVLGEKLYYKNAIYSYNNSSFEGAALASDVGSFITPLRRVIDVSPAPGGPVTALVPWRNYLTVFTEHDVHLANVTDEGATVKTVSHYAGVGLQDRKTCKSILNGIVFKSGSKIYTLYPNAASSDESILNLNEISHAIDHILEALPATTYDVFSISTERCYYTFVPYENSTICVVYDYTLRNWYVHTYEGVRFTGYTLRSLGDITLYGFYGSTLIEYYFDKTLKDAYPDIADSWDVDYDSIPYGDFLTEDSLTPPMARTELPKPQPIHFVLDSGQRTDNISLTRKFVESKFILATLNSKPAANIDVDVYIDGSPYKTRLKGDGIVFKDTPDDIITLGDDNPSDESNVYNTLSQVYLRYSGKGKTIRHVITGDSLYNFKLYEVFYRYRPMPNKQ